MRRWLLAASIIAAAAVVGLWLPSADRTELTGFARVTDGDSLRLSGERVRLHGIDAPETGQMCAGRDGIHACGKLAASYLNGLIGGRAVACSVNARDRYGRLLGVCRVRGAVPPLLLNRTMVADGWALAYGDYRAEERQARAGGHGIWAWEFEEPEAWRRQRRTKSAAMWQTTGPGAPGGRLRAWVGLGGHNE